MDLVDSKGPLEVVILFCAHLDPSKKRKRDWTVSERH
tara:strand:+ start:194 stop:304 length:111 start_codon:yes stop_codon:yes gene_type:complete